MSDTSKAVTIQYFALLREERGCSQEDVETTAETPLALYRQLQKQHGFRLDADLLKVAINEEFTGWDTPLRAGDRVVFLPPVAGG